MAAFKAGDKVLVVAREVTPEDEKSGLYYSYFGGLTGTIDRIYDDGLVCVNVDLESLSMEARDRHLAMQEAEKKKWLEGLSGEARNRLTPEQKQLKLSYKILTSSKDLHPNKGGKPGGGKSSDKSSEAVSDDNSPASKDGPARAPEPGQSASAHPADMDDGPAPKRVSEDELSKAEEEYLKSLQSKQ